MQRKLFMKTERASTTEQVVSDRYPDRTNRCARSARENVLASALQIQQGTHLDSTLDGNTAGDLEAGLATTTLTTGTGHAPM